MKYRAEIDGLRALAVVPVILFHGGFGAFRGGYIGVDVFFVISGYLITTLLLEDLQNNRFSIKRFYERRARRILPALFLVMLVCIPFAWHWMLPDPLENFGQSLIATVLFSNNILLTLTSGYWDLAAEFKPLLHTWSLGVEEQFYVFFPILLAFIWYFTKKYLLAALLTLAIISVVQSEYLQNDYPNANFYLIFSRVWELLAGSIAALILRKKQLESNELLSFLGLFAIVSAIVLYDSNTPFPSLYSLAPVLGTVLLILYCRQETLIGSVLTIPMVVKIGMISYSAYLWHQPLLAFSKVYSKNEPTVLINSLLVFATFPIAYASWRYVETPFRNKRLVPLHYFLIFVSAAGAVIIAFGIAAYTTHGFTGRMKNDELSAQQLYISYNERNMEFKRDDFAGNSQPKLLVVGDSFARDITNAVRESYNIDTIELLYRDDLNDCSVLETSLGKRLFDKADIVVFASNYNSKKPTCIHGTINAARATNTRVFYIGPKHFGFNLNWTIRVRSDQRQLLRNTLLTETIEQEAFAKSQVPEQNYISILDEISNEEGILITDSFGRLISGDRTHLTKHGAILVGDVVLRPSPLTAALERR